MNVISVYKFYKSSLLIIMAALPVVHFSTYSGQSVLVHSCSSRKVSTIATLYAFLWDVPWWETCGFGWVDWKSSLSSRPQQWQTHESTGTHKWAQSHRWCSGVSIGTQTGSHTVAILKQDSVMINMCWHGHWQFFNGNVLKMVLQHCRYQSW